MDSTEEIIRTLRKNLVNYMDSRPGLSVRSIAKLSGCNRYFLGKLLSGVKSYDFSQMLQLLKYLNEKDSIRETIDAVDSPIRDAFLAVYNPMAESKDGSKKSYEIPTELQYDFDNFMIFSLAALKNITLDMFGKCFPDNKGYKIDALIKLGVIEIRENIIRLVGEGKIFQPSCNIIELHIPEIIRRYFSPENRGQERCSQAYIYQALNRKGWTKLHKLHMEFMKNALDITSDEDLFGDIPIYSICTMDTFLSKSDSDLIDPPANRR